MLININASVEIKKAFTLSNKKTLELEKRNQFVLKKAIPSVLFLEKQNPSWIQS